MLEMIGSQIINHMLKMSLKEMDYKEELFKKFLKNKKMLVPVVNNKKKMLKVKMEHLHHSTWE